MTAMHTYYSELGERPDATKLFQRATHIGRFTFVAWRPERDTEARATFKRLRVRPVIDRVSLIGGGHKHTARLTGSAWDKVRNTGNVSVEILL